MRTSYSAERTLRIKAFAVTVMDGGGNFIGQLDVDQLGAGLRRDLTTTVGGNLMLAEYSEAEDNQGIVLTPGGAIAVSSVEASTTFTVSARRTALGEGAIDDLTLINPRLGAFNVTISSAGLVAYAFEVTVTSGHPSSLDACGCPTCQRRSADGVCVDLLPYSAAARVSLRDALVVIRDAGGALVGDNWDDEETRNVTGELVYGRNHATSAEFTYTVNMTVLSNSSQTYLEAKEGMVAWCHNGEGSDPIPRFCRPGDDISLSNSEAASRAYFAELRRTGLLGLAPPAENSATKIDYYGILSEPRWVGNAHGLNLDFPYAGVYKFQFSSFCPPDVCEGAKYHALQFDQLEITVVPGVPNHLEFLREPPVHFENDFIIDPAIEIMVLDIAGNICTNLNTFSSVKILPQERRLHGQTAPVIGGIATFPRLKVQGNRGSVYTLRFSMVTIGLEIDHSPFLILSCDTVKPNSQNDGRGQCECLPGYTEDVRTVDAGGTGFTDVVFSISTYPGLYEQVIHRPENYLQTLNPYGVCVPCANGYFKPLPGPQECTPCPYQMDTMWEGGAPRESWTTLSGESLPGHLGNHERDSCHCIVRRLATQGEAPLETYRILPYDDFRCDLCPDGGLCNGLSKQYIVINPGRWRASQNMTDIYTCPNQDACLGGEGSECSTGYEGNLCSVCSSGYAQPTLGGQILRICSKCTPEYIGTIVLIAQFVAQSLIVLTIFRVASRERNASVGLCKTLLSHFQMLVSVSSPHSLSHSLKSDIIRWAIFCSSTQLHELTQ